MSGASGASTGGAGTSERGSTGTAGSTASCTMCGDECVDLNENADHCGKCGRACTMEGVATRKCEDGLCVSLCHAGRGNCYQPPASDPDDGCETDKGSNVDHCGACRRACVTGGEVDEADCVAGRCTSTCKDDSLNLSRPEEPEPDDGCEVVFATNVEHCGAKGRACSSTNVAKRVCEDGVCTSACAKGYANVSRPEAQAEDDGCELDIATNPDDCGAPGRGCSSERVATRTCAGGVCTSTCAGGYWSIKLPAAPSVDDGCEAVCPATTGGPTLVRMPGGYCIDSTEVTKAQYAAWLDTLGSLLPTQAEECSWNESLAPTCDWDPAAKPNYPVVCVDWCDAYAYCQGVGKRLCGNRGGGANTYDKYADAADSQWYAACSSAGTNEYPYGDDYVSNACNGDESGTDATVEVGTLESCQAPAGSGYEGVFDLSGNVWEWEDSCEVQVGQSDLCRLRGGSLCGFGGSLSCACDASYSRNLPYDGVGFRCCAP